MPRRRADPSHALSTKRNPLSAGGMSLRAARTAWPVVALGTVLCAPGAWAQEGPNKPITRIEPYVSVEESLTDRASDAGGQKRADAVTTARVGVRVLANGARVRGALDYGLSGYVYARNNDLNKHQHSLAMNGELEWYERQGFLRADATITQIPRTALGAQTGLSGLPSASSSEVKTLSLVPSWRGQVAGLVRVDTSLSLGATRGSGLGTSDSDSQTFSFVVTPYEIGRLTWALGLQSQHFDSSVSRSNQTNWVYGRLAYDLRDWDLRVSGSVGRERSDVVSLVAQSRTTYGLGLEWQPSPRTRVVMQTDEHTYGRTHSITAEYRTPRTRWAFTDARSLQQNNTGLCSGGATDLVRVYCLRYAGVASLQNLSLQEFEAFVLERLKEAGINGFAAAYLTHRTSFATSWEGPRLNSRLALNRSRSEPVDPSQVGALGPEGPVQQFRIDWTNDYKLDKELSMTLVTYWQRNRALRTGTRTNQSGLGLRLSGRLSPKNTWSVALTHDQYGPALQPSYSANTITAAYGIRF